MRANLNLNEIVESQKSLIFFAVDRKFRYTFFTKTHAHLMLTLWGNRVKIGDSPLTFITKGADKKRATDNLKKALQGKYFSREESFSSSNGEKHYFQNKYAPIISKAGKIIGATVFSFDITDRRLSEIVTEQSNSLLEATINSSVNGILVVDLKGKAVLFNRKFLDMMNHSPKLLERRVDAEMMAELLPHLKDPEQFLERVKYLYAHPKEEGNDLMEFQDGRVYARYTVPQKAKGKIIGRIWTFLDITEQQKAERELKYRENRYRTLQEASFGGIGLHDKGIILDANSGLSELTGYTLNELKGMNGLNLIAPEYREMVAQKIMQNYPHAYDVMGLRKNGSQYYLEVRGKSFQAEGKVLRVTEFRDITERKLNEEKIRDQNARLAAIAQNLRKKNDQLEEFTQIVSHNLRSPVGNISSLLEHYEKSTDEKERSDMIHHMRISVDSLLLTMQELNEILKVSQTGPMEVNELDFSSVLNKVLTMLHTNILNQKAVIEQHFEVKKIVYSPLYLESIFLNLISNALKYASMNRTPVIKVSSFLEEGYPVLIVEDNGMGIDMNRFGHQVFKLRKTFHDHADSRGVGLFMVKNQVEAMGGEINVMSEVEKGCTFTIHFGKQNVL